MTPVSMKKMKEIKKRKEKEQETARVEETMVRGEFCIKHY